MFGTRHLIALAVCITAGILMCVFLRRLEITKWFRLLLCVGIVSETVKVFYYILANEDVYGGYLPKTDLPFHLCSVQLIFIAVLNFSKNEKLKRAIMAFMIPTCLIGGIAAIMIPTSSSLESLILTFQYFSYHTVIAVFSVCLLLKSGEMEWDINDYASALKMLALMGLIAVYINSMTYDVVEYAVDGEGKKAVEFVSRVNFMYVVDPPVSGLPFLNKDRGWLVYFIRLAFTAFVAVTLCYIKPVFKALSGLIYRKKENEP
ncbi:MAG: YwaF family protein [Clostridiales bacterium]|nr:YwaF family protein [Clostridiales bacterium]